MDQLQTRLDALEQQMLTITRRLRWWRGLACALLALAALTWALPLSTAQEGVRSGEKGLAQRVAALEDLLQHFSRKGNDVFLTGANLHLVNGLGSTDCLDAQGEPIPDCPKGVGNLIVGYNELRVDDPSCPFTIIGCSDVRTGSHNVVVGLGHNFSRVGGLVVGLFNEISGDFAAVSGGWANTASSVASSVTGGGEGNTASSTFATVSGGRGNRASGNDFAAVSGETFNTASAFAAAVSGGHNRTAEGEADWVAGSLFEDE
jgi:hypothetical protein